MLSGVATSSIRQASRLSSRRQTALRLTSPDAVVYAAQFQPAQFITAASILTTFFFVQRQINKSNALLESLKVAKDELKKVRNEALSGTNDSEKINELGLVIKQLEQQWKDTATLRLPGSDGVTLRYRVQRPDLIPDEGNNEATAEETIESQSTEVSSRVSGTSNNENVKLKEITPLQGFLLVVGVVVVLVQVWLLTLLSVDPMAASSTIADYTPLNNLPPPQPLLDSFQ